VIFTLSQALYTLILELCGTEARAKFWISYLNVMLVITPLLAVFIFGTSSMLVQASFGFFRNALTCILSGIFVSLSAIGFQIMQSIPNKSQHNNDPWGENLNV
jgi:nitrate reductase NapE component